MSPIEKCPSCRGQRKITCPLCNGNGTVSKKGNILEMGFGSRVECPGCKGVGELICDLCKGSGFVDTGKPKTGW
jgi:DnaJ-class molecular chaperone